jgi:hypothetical protein
VARTSGRSLFDVSNSCYRSLMSSCMFLLGEKLFLLRVLFSFAYESLQREGWKRNLIQR